MAGADGLSPSGSAIPVHPDVTFKRLPFYDIMGELLKPTSLGECNSQGFGNTLPDLSNLVPIYSGQVRNFNVLVLGQV